MGCWGIGGQWGEVSERQAIRTVHAALDAGVNLFDTADSHGQGQRDPARRCPHRSAQLRVTLSHPEGNAVPSGDEVPVPGMKSPSRQEPTPWQRLSLPRPHAARHRRDLERPIA